MAPSTPSTIKMLVRTVLVLSVLMPAVCFCPSRLSILRSVDPASQFTRLPRITHPLWLAKSGADKERGGALQVVSKEQRVPLLLDYSAAATAGVQRLSVGGQEVQVALFSDQVAVGAEDSGVDLTGLRVWPTNGPMLELLQSEVLPQLRRQRPPEQRAAPLRILELGSGSGLMGVALAALGEQVVLTDPAFDLTVSGQGGEMGVVNTLGRLQDNIELNRNKFETGNASAIKLLWGDEADIENAKDHGPYDAIIACDVTYSPEAFEALLLTMECLAAPQGTPVFLGYNTLYVRFSEFLELAKESFAIVTTNIGDGWKTTGSGGLYSQLAECRYKR